MASDPSQRSNPAMLKHLFEHNLNKLYDGKRYIGDNLSHLIDISSFETSKLVLGELQDDIDKQLIRLDEIYKVTGITPSDEECIPIKAIFKETFVLERRKGMITNEYLSTQEYKTE
jgi:hypothetical protein